jgi:preprotein translocase subunit Sec61beta
MARAKKVYIPASYGGLIRYPEEGKEKIKLKPEHLVWLTVGVILFEIILRLVF